MTVLIAALTLAACGGNDLATPPASGQAADNCTIEAPLITTSEGSKDVRNELNEMYRQVLCRNSELDSETTKAESARKLERARTKTALEECYKSTGLCLEELAAESESRNPASGNRYSDLEWTLHDAWLNAWRSIYNLARIYPNSVQPKFLSMIISAGENANSCSASANRRWCRPSQ
jgi:hypothetical protein